MTTLLKNGTVVNVFTGELLRSDVLFEDGKIIGVGDYADTDADTVEDVSGKYLCPGFIDGHIHIESTMLTPAELAKMCLPCGTTSIVADPHEIANVCGVDGIKYMLESSRGLPMNVYFTLPSCVPATPFDESGAVLTAAELEPLYAEERVVGLAEMMNYPGVLMGDSGVAKKIADARAHGKGVDGHAPFLSGHGLDRYVSAGIKSDHECSTLDEALEKLRKGQWIMIRQGTAARNLEALLPLFDEKYSHRCLLVTDDRHPADIAAEGHIDNIIRLAVKAGRSAVTAIQMATIQAAQCFGLNCVGAIAPAYRADILVLDDLDTVAVRDVYSAGVKVVDNGRVADIKAPAVDAELTERVHNSFNVGLPSASDFHIEEKGGACRVIDVVHGQLITRELICDIDWSKNNGVDVERDIIKLAVIERHSGTGHKGVGFIHGIGLKRGAIASSVSHDSHNLIVIGTNNGDMAVAAEHICRKGGNVVVADGKIISEMPLPVGGLMTELSGEEIAKQNAEVRRAVYALGAPSTVEPFMNMAFVSLAVIPSLKMTTLGLVDVDEFRLKSLYAEEN
ncbi:MAG: adenine deaminase [Ruminococcaceae bacterium]|nr:adenine deaminase [Oscillospiraceae bacterium]